MKYHLLPMVVNNGAKSLINSMLQHVCSFGYDNDLERMQVRGRRLPLADTEGPVPRS